MEKTIPKQVTNLLYTQMTNEELNTMTDHELIWFYGNLHNWSELTMKRIDERRKSHDCQM